MGKLFALIVVLVIGVSQTVRADEVPTEPSADRVVYLADLQSKFTLGEPGVDTLSTWSQPVPVGPRTTEIQPVAIPIPPAAWTGTAMLGLLGFVRYLRGGSKPTSTTLPHLTPRHLDRYGRPSRRRLAD